MEALGNAVAFSSPLPIQKASSQTSIVRFLGREALTPTEIGCTDLGHTVERGGDQMRSAPIHLIPVQRALRPVACDC